MIKLVQSDSNLIFKHKTATTHHFARVNQVWYHNATEDKRWKAAYHVVYNNTFFSNDKNLTEWDKMVLTDAELAEIVADTLLQ